MATGISGECLYLAGGSYFVFPSGTAAHDLSQLTLIWYFQRNAAVSPKQIICAAGSGTQAGDFSLEVLADGRLRGFHTGADAVLRFFEANSTAIPGTNLAVDTAYRLALTMGPAGTKLYVGDTLISTIVENTNGWNNARQKYWNAWTDGVQSPGDAAYDRIRLFRVQFSDTIIANFEAAHSITIGAPVAPSGDELSVPSLAEWLDSDVADVTVTKYVEQQNRGSGNGSSAANAQEVQAALTARGPATTSLGFARRPVISSTGAIPTA